MLVLAVLLYWMYGDLTGTSVDKNLRGLLRSEDAEADGCLAAARLSNE